MDMDGTGGKHFDEHHAEQKERNKVKSKDVSAVSLGINVSQHIRKTRVADEENDIAFLEEKRRKAAMLVKSAELKENLRTGPWTLVVSRRGAHTTLLSCVKHFDFGDFFCSQLTFVPFLSCPVFVVVVLLRTPCCQTPPHPATLL
jgi:hypothetical protein